MPIYGQAYSPLKEGEDVSATGIEPVRRPDIEGLRAVAVLPIVAYHAGLTQMSGGFIGVDVFFVISGFLITGAITRGLGMGTFSLLGFYKNRVTRILPALIVMLAVVLFVGCRLMLPSELKPLAMSAAASAGFLSNVYFWQAADYFASTADLEPLLHTWSLGVEEQFYIIFPLIVMAIWRLRPAALGLTVAVLTALSFGASLLLGWIDPASGFYLLPSRAWELGLGSMVALGLAPTLRSTVSKNIAALAGLGLILAGLWLIKPESAFPAPWALLPCLGSALLIAYGPGGLTGRFLTLSPMRWVGNISYSLYLWHWPIIAFYRLTHGTELSPTESGSLVLASLVAAWLSYELVEKPFHKDRLWIRNATAPRAVWAGSAGLGVVAAAAFAVSANAGSWRPYPAEVLRLDSFAAYRTTEEQQYQFRKGECFLGEKDAQTFDTERCLTVMYNRENIVVLGDSFAAQYWRAISLRFPDKNVLQANASGCKPTLETEGARRCTQMVEHVLGPMASSGRIQGVVLAARWREADLALLPRTIETLQRQGVAVTVVGPSAEYQGDFPRLLARATMQGLPSEVRQFQRPGRAELDRRMREVVEQAGGRYLSAYDVQCPQGRCRLYAPDRSPFHFDYGHMTLSASHYIVAALPSV